MRKDLNKNRWGRRWASLVGLVVIPCGMQGQEAAEDADVVELRAVISKVVDVKAQAAAERMEWEARKTEMAELLELYGREMAMLDEELALSGESAGGYDESKQRAEEEIAELRRVRTLAGEVVARSKPRALSLLARFPAPLAAEVEVERVKLDSWRAGDEPRDGLQAILGMVAKAEQFNRRIRRSREVRDGQEVEVIYLGLARAYYVARNGDAGVGEPGAAGWSWTPNPAVAGEVRKALAQLDRKRPPELVELPVKIVDGEGQR